MGKLCLIDTKKHRELGKEILNGIDRTTADKTAAVCVGFAASAAFTLHRVSRDQASDKTQIIQQIVKRAPRNKDLYAAAAGGVIGAFFGESSFDNVFDREVDNEAFLASRVKAVLDQ